MNNKTLYLPTLIQELYSLFGLASPLIMTGFIQSTVFFFETLFLAHLGQHTLAAGALAGWLFNTSSVILFGTLNSVNVLISRKLGANDQAGILLVTRDGLLLALLLAVPACLLVWNIPWIFLLFGQSPSVVLLARSYLHALTWGIAPDLMVIAILELIIGLGHTRIILLFTTLTVTLNLFFSYSLIFGKFRFPALGISGAGFGTAISYWIVLISLITYVLTHKIYKKYFHHIFNINKPSYLWDLLKIGLPMGMMYCFEVAFFFVFSLIMGSISSQLLAANQIASQYMVVVLTIIFNLAQAITIRMGYLLGAKKIDLAKKTSYAGILIATGFIGIVAIGYIFFSKVLISIDIDIHNPQNTVLIHKIEEFFAISLLFLLFEAIRISLYGSLRALKDTRFTMLTSIFSLWCISLPVGYLLAIYFNMQGIGLWYGMVLGVIISMTILWWRFSLKIKCLKIRVK